MTPRDRSRRLDEIVAVRAVQQQAAEQRVAEANQALIRLEARRADQEAALDRDQRHWLATLGAPSLSLSMLRAWSAEILRREADLRETARAVEQADVTKAERGQAWRLATALADTAAELAGRARQAERRRLDEVRLNDVADRLAHRVAPW